MNEENDVLMLKPIEREFVHEMIFHGLNKEEAYSLVTTLEYTEENKKRIQSAARKMLYKPAVQEYYQAMLEEVREREVKKGVWTKEVATEKLMHLIEKAESELYGDERRGVPGKPITMSRLNAIVLPAKELNLMNGFNATNLNMSGGVVVQFEGEDEIPD